MIDQESYRTIRARGRQLEIAQPYDPQLGHLKLLPGLWKNEPNLPGRGWNMIALPFAGQFNYRVLVNQYNESLLFKVADKGVPNRGIKRNGSTVNDDQTIVALDYEQGIRQLAADDSPQSGLAGDPDKPIHHEPGLFLHMLDKTEDGLELARLATIPHGDSVLALGRVRTYDGPPVIPDINSLPIGVDQSLTNPYLAPYVHFQNNPFLALFNPILPNELLKAANTGVDIVRTTEFEFDTTFATGGIVNIPFIVAQANATEMKAHFWIQELAEKDPKGYPKLRLQYSQTVFLDFFPRRDGQPGLIRWPHVSINTMEKVVEEPKEVRREAVIQ
jgi:hypothetical protein